MVASTFPLEYGGQVAYMETNPYQLNLVYCMATLPIWTSTLHIMISVFYYLELHGAIAINENVVFYQKKVIYVS
jgi:hypothetical protein